MTMSSGCSIETAEGMGSQESSSLIQIMPTSSKSNMVVTLIVDPLRALKPSNLSQKQLSGQPESPMHQKEKGKLVRPC